MCSCYPAIDFSSVLHGQGELCTLLEKCRSVRAELDLGRRAAGRPIAIAANAVSEPVFDIVSRLRRRPLRS